MIYVFDSSSFIPIFRYYYPERFPSFWEHFNRFIVQGKIVSVKEVARELRQGEDYLSKWARLNNLVFPPPTFEELEFVSSIFKIPHFQSIIRRQEILKGSPVADPFVIAKAHVIDGCVISDEIYKKNAAKIPNICEHFDIQHMHFREFMEKENWTF